MAATAAPGPRSGGGGCRPAAPCQSDWHGLGDLRSQRPASRAEHRSASAAAAAGAPAAACGRCEPGRGHLPSRAGPARMRHGPTAAAGTVGPASESRHQPQTRSPVARGAATDDSQRCGCEHPPLRGGGANCVRNLVLSVTSLVLSVTSQ